MVYRKIIYEGNTLVSLLKRIEEIKIRGEEVRTFSIECEDGWKDEKEVKDGRNNREIK